MVFEVIDCAEEDFNVKDELLSHTYSVEILSIADLPQHIGDASSARLLEGRQDTNVAQEKNF